MYGLFCFPLLSLFGILLACSCMEWGWCSGSRCIGNVTLTIAQTCFMYLKSSSYFIVAAIWRSALQVTTLGAKSDTSPNYCLDGFLFRHRLGTGANYPCFLWCQKSYSNDLHCRFQHMRAWGHLQLAAHTYIISFVFHVVLFLLISPPLFFIYFVVLLWGPFHIQQHAFFQVYGNLSFSNLKSLPLCRDRNMSKFTSLLSLIYYRTCFFQLSFTI